MEAITPERRARQQDGQDRAGEGGFDPGMAALGPVDPSSPVPLYAQVAARMAAYIENLGDEGIGRQLASENECIRLFNVSRPTVRQAVSELISRGLVRKERGRGTFICDNRLEHDISHIFEEDVRAARRQAEYRLLEHGLAPAGDKLKEVFGAGTDQVYRVLRLRLVSGRVLGLEERFFPVRFAPFLSEDVLKRDHVFAILRLCTDAGEVSSLNIVHASMLDEAGARLLDVPLHSQVLVRETTYFVGKDTPVMYGIVTFLADRYQLRFQSRIGLRRETQGD